MTAGSGLQHSEMFPLLNGEKENTLELFQIWLNQPAAKKFVSPAYKMLWDETVPSAIFEGPNKKRTIIDVVAGSIDKYSAPEPTPDSWAANTANEVAVWHIKMEENATWEIPVASKEVNRTLYFFEGESMKVAGEKILPSNAVYLDASQKIILENGDKKSRCLLLQGKPLNEKVVQYGPFVMNSEAEIRQAFADYRETQFGGWPWSRPDPVFEKTKGRFARFVDGSEIQK